jgi:hypothetical protein
VAATAFAIIILREEPGICTVFTLYSSVSTSAGTRARLGCKPDAPKPEVVESAERVTVC